jgi:hypothetical protein
MALTQFSGKYVIQSAMCAAAHAVAARFCPKHSLAVLAPTPKLCNSAESFLV